MEIREDGAVTGSVSGGCIEDDLINEMHQEGMQALCANGVPALRTYGIKAEDAHRFGLPCGGTMELVLEPIGKQSALSELIAQLELRQPMRRSLDMATGK